MQPLGKALKTATLEGRPWKQELNRFLLQYRTTPHCTTGVPPSELLFNIVVKGKIPAGLENVRQPARKCSIKLFAGNTFVFRRTLFCS